MDEIRKALRLVNYQLQFYQKELDEIHKRMETLGDVRTSIVIKKIRRQPYYYLQWRESDGMHYRSLGKVMPGAVCMEEKKIMQRKQLLDRQKDMLFLTEKCMKLKSQLMQQIEDRPVLEEYFFEVFWKNELTARVHVKKSTIRVTRLIRHPVKQLFASDKMTRYQLQEIFKMRCFEEGRADSMDKLQYLGLDSYNPYEIVKRTHGVSYNDFIWFRFQGEALKAEDVLVRKM